MNPRRKDYSYFRLLNYTQPRQGDTVGRMFKGLSTICLALILVAFAYGKSIQDSFGAHPERGRWLLSAIMFGVIEAVVFFVASLIRQYGGKAAPKDQAREQQRANRISVVWACAGTLVAVGYVCFSMVALRNLR